MRNSTIKKFCKQVGKKLQCTTTTKKDLLRGLADELLESLPPDITSTSSIESCVGTVNQVAEELQTTVSQDEVNRMKAKHRRITFLVIFVVLVFILIVFLISMLIFINGPFYITESIKEI